SQYHHNQNASAQAPLAAAASKPKASDRNHGDSITDDVIEISPENDHQQSIDDDLER
ncbi:unnamed protein product, partial [Rotaria magnacalcarata]